MTTVQLLVVQGRPAGKSLPFPCGDYYIGRGTECHIRPDSDWVSRQHCLLRVTPEGVFLRDLGSRNGTLVNGRLLSGECRLYQGDCIQIGPLVLELRLDAPHSAPDAALDPTVNAQNETVDASPRPSPVVKETPKAENMDTLGPL